jgi:hypothetical protein
VIDGFRHAEGFFRFGRFCRPVGHCAETAAAGAAVAQNQESCCALRKALAQIGAAGFLAHGVKMCFLEEPTYFLIRRAARYSPLEPRGFG